MGFHLLRVTCRILVDHEERSESIRCLLSDTPQMRDPPLLNENPILNVITQRVISFYFNNQSVQYDN